MSSGLSLAPPDRPLDTWLVVGLVLAVIFTTASLGGVNYLVARSHTIDQEEAKLVALADAKETQIDAAIDKYETATALIAGQSALRETLNAHNDAPDADLRRSMSSSLADAIASSELVDSATLSDPTGQVVASSDPAAIGTSLADGPLGFDRSAELDEPLRVLPWFDDATLKVFVRVPIEWEGSTIGMLHVEVEDGALVRAGDAAGFGETGEILVGANDAERDVVVFVAPHRDDVGAVGKVLAPLTATDVPMIRALLGDGGTWSEGVVDYDGIPVMATARYLPRVDWGLVIKIDRDEALAEVREIGQAIVALILLVGGLTGIVGVLIRRRLSASLADRRRAENRFTSLFVSSPVPLLEVDGEGGIRLVNDRAADLLRATPDDLVGRKIEELVPTAHRGRDRLWWTDYVASPGPKPMESARDVTVVAVDGTEIPVTVSLTPIDFGGRATVVACLFDLTEHRMAAEELALRAERERRLVDQLRRSNAELEKLATHAAHDMQEPLRKIEAFATRLESELGPDISPAAVDSLRRMTRAARRMRALIQDLLDYARATKGTEDTAPIDLLALLDTVADGFEGDEAIIVVSGSPVEAWGNEARMSRVFTNLLGNALKYRHPDRRPEVQISVSEAVIDGNNRSSVHMARVAIADNGIGLDPKYAERIFEMFQRLHTQSDYEGTGLGLPICQRIVEQHHGSITATGVEGEGATFVVHLPLAANHVAVGAIAEPADSARPERIPEAV